MIVFLIACGWKGQSFGQSKESSSELELRTAIAECRKNSSDWEKVANCMADEYLQTDIWGNVQDKTTWLNEYFKPLAELIRLGKFHWELYKETDLQIRMYGDAAVVIGNLELKGTGARPMPHAWVADPNAHPNIKLRFTRVYIKRNGKWLLVGLHNAVPAAEDD